jgi:cytoskeletal protein CcmA (bactofilin family)
MFNAKNSTNLTPSNSTGSISIIGEDVFIKGDIEVGGDLRIDGKISGNLNGKSKIIIGQHGFVEGNISGNNAEIMGSVKGNINLTGQLNLIGKSKITGDIHVAKLQMESTVCFNGKCTMGANIVELNNEHSVAVNE